MFLEVLLTIRKQPDLSSATLVFGKSISAPTIVYDTPTPEYDNIVAIENITLQEKNLDESSPPSSSILISPIASTHKPPTGLVEICVNSLQQMENFWIVYNKAKVDYMEIKVEKRLLEKNNKQLRGMIRGILESLVLSQSQPSSNVSTRIPSRSRSSYSAPLRRIVLQ